MILEALKNSSRVTNVINLISPTTNLATITKLTTTADLTTPADLTNTMPSKFSRKWYKRMLPKLTRTSSSHNSTHLSTCTTIDSAVCNQTVFRLKSPLKTTFSNVQLHIPDQPQKNPPDQDQSHPQNQQQAVQDQSLPRNQQQSVQDDSTNIVPPRFLESQRHQQSLYQKAVTDQEKSYFLRISSLDSPEPTTNTTTQFSPFDRMKRFTKNTRNPPSNPNKPVYSHSQSSSKYSSILGSPRSQSNSSATGSTSSMSSYSSNTTASTNPSLNSDRKPTSRIPSLPMKQSYGLLSKGNSNSLQTSEHDRQEYFDSIQTHFLQLAVSVNDPKIVPYARNITVSKNLVEEITTAPINVVPIDTILMQLRVLREAILSIPPTEFHKHVLIYSILVSALYGHYQTYTPSFLTLINDVLPELYETTQLEDYFHDDSQFQLVCTIYIYHLIHYANDPVEAFRLLGQYFSPESPIYEFIGSWTDKDYFQWRRAFDNESDPALHRIMAFGEITMAQAALAKVGKSYHRMERNELEHTIGMQWPSITQKLGCEWQLENDFVYIRKR